jgi:ABC-2 type transport system ATP-binding protein
VSGFDARLEAADLVIGYRTRRGIVEVARASFSVSPGTVAAILGPNGAGKTTLLRTMVGTLPPLSGQVTLGAMPLPQVRATRGIGYLPENPVLPAHWTPRALLALTATGGSIRDDDIREALELAGVDFDLDRPLKAASKGMVRRLSIATVLLRRSPLVLLDEPEAGLDPAQRINLRERLRSFVSARRTLLLASHDVSGALDAADRFYFLGRGTLTEVGREDLRDSHRILRLFGEGVV